MHHPPSTAYQELGARGATAQIRSVSTRGYGVIKWKAWRDHARWRRVDLSACVDLDACDAVSPSRV
ncbi:hypothetical protein EDWATA_03065 [Edwardsiella tarda ATCC 23685]|uniref:Uncharacterized protein n=1 Tax=Edwardsiella tarda ATCC 23685 TaxID=500638 RepID=D4F8H2_EDWTA|nr:hypothetical protein EDWATA_03065 [Edwardsiella tarda ATCC 23685]